MKLRDRLNLAVQVFQKADNSMGADLSRQFLKHGNNKPLVQDWSKVIVTDEELYTGYSYGAIDRRANRVVKLSKKYLKTDAAKPIQEKAKEADEPVIHPYLQVIDDSDSFSNRKFWYDISTYLDLEGVYFILVIRNVGSNPNGTQRIGSVQEFKLMNPFNVKRIRNKETGEIGGYVENWQGMTRALPKEMVIDIRKLNPFDDDDPFGMIDAAKSNQYTLKQSGDYTRHALKNNMAAPGILNTDVLLEPEQFTNFVSRVTNQEKGLPLFGNGAGAISWDDMQIDLDKSALKDTTEINRQELFSVAGTSKTVMGIEESGTTRDTSAAQIELFTEFHAGPQMELIIDALNQDYKKYYKEEYKTNKYVIELEDTSPKNKEAELQDQEIRDAQFATVQTLVNAGYDLDVAARYAQGELTIEELGAPQNDMVEVATDPNGKLVLPEPAPKKAKGTSDANPQKNP